MCSNTSRSKKCFNDTQASCDHCESHEPRAWQNTHSFSIFQRYLHFIICPPRRNVYEKVCSDEWQYIIIRKLTLVFPLKLYISLRPTEAWNKLEDCDFVDILLGGPYVLLESHKSHIKFPKVSYHFFAKLVNNIPLMTLQSW